MRKLRITTVAAVVGVLFVLAIFFMPWLSHIRALGWFYAPAILVSLIVSGTHAPDAVSVWAGTIAQTGVLLTVFIVVWALSQEAGHFRAVAPQLEEAKEHLAKKEVEEAFAAFSRGLAEVNRRRQKTLFLEPLPTPSAVTAAEGMDPGTFAARAVTDHPKHRVVKRMFRDVEHRLESRVGHDSAVALMEQLRRHAANRGRPQPAGA